MSGHACCLKLTGNDPSSDLIKQSCLDAAVKSSHPALEIFMRFPDAHDIISILKELHLESKRIRRATSKTVVALLFKSQIGIKYFLHDSLFCSFETLGVLSNHELVKDILDRTVHENRKVVHGVVDTVVGHT